MKAISAIFALLFGVVSCGEKARTSSGAAKPVPAPPPVQAARQGKLMLMHYMPWYETPAVRGKWGAHWTGHQQEHNPEKKDAKGMPDIWSHFHPLIGLYDSTDPTVLECQMLQMKLAGVDGVVVDWYGLGKVADYPAIHQAAQAVFLAAERHGMLFSLCYEDRTIEYLIKTGALQPEGTAAHLKEMADWLDANWFGAAHYARIDGRPLLLNFGPLAVKDKAAWDGAMRGRKSSPIWFGLHHLWRNGGADGGFTWVHGEAWREAKPGENPVTRLAETYRYPSANPAEVIVSAYPGFKDVYAQPHPVLEHRDGETLRESLGVCMQGPWQTVQLVTWNDYGEGTMIEPTHEFGYKFLEIIQQARRDELKQSFLITKEDLRLPAALLELRRQGTHEERELDFISRLISQGACEEATRRIHAMNPSTLARP